MESKYIDWVDNWNIAKGFLSALYDTLVFRDIFKVDFCWVDAVCNINIEVVLIITGRAKRNNQTVLRSHFHFYRTAWECYQVQFLGPLRHCNYYYDDILSLS